MKGTLATLLRFEYERKTRTNENASRELLTLLQKLAANPLPPSRRLRSAQSSSGKEDSAFRISPSDQKDVVQTVFARLLVPPLAPLEKLRAEPAFSELVAPWSTPEVPLSPGSLLDEADRRTCGYLQSMLRNAAISLGRKSEKAGMPGMEKESLEKTLEQFEAANTDDKHEKNTQASLHFEEVSRDYNKLCSFLLERIGSSHRDAWRESLELLLRVAFEQDSYQNAAERLAKSRSKETPPTKKELKAARDTIDQRNSRTRKKLREVLDEMRKSGALENDVAETLDRLLLLFLDAREVSEEELP